MHLKNFCFCLGGGTCPLQTEGDKFLVPPPHGPPMSRKPEILQHNCTEIDYYTKCYKIKFSISLSSEMRAGPSTSIARRYTLLRIMQWQY